MAQTERHVRLFRNGGNQALAKIRKLYAIEKLIESLDVEQKR